MYSPHFETKDEFKNNLLRCTYAKELPNLVDLTTHLVAKNIDELFDSICPESPKPVLTENNTPSSVLLNNTILIVKDLDKFLELMRVKSFIINPGIQKDRGLLNSNSYFLYSIDEDYRNYLLFHYNKDKTGLDTRLYNYKLDRRHFSFRNIHMNLGQVR